MPLFDFACDQCGEVREVLQAHGAAAPSCCGRPMERQASIAAFRVEGYCAKTGYTVTSPHKQPQDMKGIRTIVKGG